MQTHIPPATRNPGFIQGATIQKTWPPFSNVFQPEWRRYDAEDRQMNRYIVDAKPQIHQGATKLRTDPVPPVSRPEFAYALFAGRAWEDGHQNRFIVDAKPQLHQGATRISTDP